MGGGGYVDQKGGESHTSLWQIAPCIYETRSANREDPLNTFKYAQFMLTSQKPPWVWPGDTRGPLLFALNL